MNVDILIGESSAVLTVLSSLQVGQGKLPGFSTRVLFSWEELQSRATDGAFDVAIIEPDFPGRDRAGRVDVGGIERVGATAGSGAVIHYVSRAGFRKGLLYDLHALRCRFVIIQGEDDDRRSILRVLSRAANLRPMRASLLGASGMEDLVHSEPFLTSLVGWPVPRSVSDLARHLHMSPRTLRRRMHDQGLLPPQQMIRWGQLLEARTLHGMGVQSRARLAALLGKSDPSALAHLCRGLTGLSAQEVLAGKAEGGILENLVSQLKGA